MSFLTGGAGGISASGQAGAEAGDVSSGLDFSLATNNAFTFGGSGSVSSRSDASGAGGNPNAAALPPSQQSNQTNLPLLIALGVVGLVSVAAVIKK